MSVHKTKNGTWRVKWRDQYGAQCTMHFKRKGDADDWQSKLRLGQVEKERPQARLTFGDFANRWLRDHADVHHEVGTKINADGYIRNWFIPAFGKKYLSDIRPTDIISLQRKIHVEKGRAEKTANNIILALKKMLSDAVKWKIIRENPAESIELLDFQKKKKPHWTRVECERFLTYCKSRNPHLYEAALLTIHTGMRRGELKGLKRDCVDFERGTIAIERTWDEKLKDVKNYTKGKDIRYVPMTPEVSRVLADRKLLRPDQYMISYDLISLVRDPYHEMAKAAGVKRLTWHNLRDTYGSHLSEAGVPELQIQYLMGHKDAKTTKGYMHLNPNFHLGVVEALRTGVYDPTTAQKAGTCGQNSDVPFLFRFEDSGSGKGF